MPAVVRSIPSQKFSHHNGDAVFAALKKKMDMVIHQDPGINGTCSFDNVLPEAFKKSRLVLVVFEYVRFIDPSHHNVVQGSWYIESRLPWHEIVLLEKIGLSSFCIPGINVPNFCVAGANQSAQLNCTEAIWFRNS
jgi:hypothetical protein